MKQRYTKHKTLIKRACEKAIKNHIERRRRTQKYWDDKLKEAKEKQ